MVFIILYTLKNRDLAVKNYLVLIGRECSDLRRLLLAAYSLDPNHQESNLQIKSKQHIFLELGGKHLSMCLCSKQLQHYFSLDYPIIVISSRDPECIWLKLMDSGYTEIL